SAKLQSRPDDTPVAFFTTVTAPEDTPVDGRAVVASRPERATSYRIIAGPQSALLHSFDTSTGVFRILPDTNFFGRVSFRFEATSDGISHDLVSNDADVDIDFTAVPDPPVVVAPFVTLSENATVSFAPAQDPDGDSLTYTIVTPPLHGIAVVNDQVIAYTPETGFTGSDSLTYKVSDGTTTVGPALVEIFVGPVDDIPVVHDQDLEVTSGSATRVVLDVIDPDSPNIEYWWDDFPTFGDFRGSGSNYVYVPHPGVQQATEDVHFRVFDGLSTSQTATLHITISPGSHPCTLLTGSEVTAVYPELTIGDKLYFRAVLPPTPQQFVMVTDGTQFDATIVQFADSDTFGFDNNVGGNRRTTFFNVQSTTFFTTSTNTYASRLFAQTNLGTAQVVNDIPAPATNLAAEPAVGDAYVEGSAAYLPIHWPTTTGQYVCQLWKIDSLTSQTSLFKTFPEANSPCSGLWNMAGEQYMFVGANLYKFSGLQSAPVLVADLGNALPEPWMVEAGGKLFFQTRTAVGLETQIDLWVTDGTTNGTKVVKQLEMASLEFDVFSPVAFLNKLYFAHRKSLWMSDGTDAGTQIVATMPVGSAVGNGAIGKITVGNGKLFFLANSDAAGREPWVSDGTTAGT
ncbi:MAG TPA: Ig-like domain-containing protein, partial [Polyangium sp.]|nr:Ig-like domain-containing protein [Polyangium sp.]